MAISNNYIGSFTLPIFANNKPKIPDNVNHIIIDNNIKNIETIELYRFFIFPGMMAEEHIAEWAESDVGKWAIEHCVSEIQLRKFMNVYEYQNTYVISGRFLTEDITFFHLKFK